MKTKLKNVGGHEQHRAYLLGRKGESKKRAVVKNKPSKNGATASAKNSIKKSIIK